MNEVLGRLSTILDLNMGGEGQIRDPLGIRKINHVKTIF